jgi:hypothetical protein
MNNSLREPSLAHNHESTTRNPMKRACMLGVMAALIAAGTLFTAPAAQAQIVCTIKNLSGPGGINVTWPFTTDVTACTGTTPENLLKMQHGLLAVVNQHSRMVNGKQVGKGPVLQAKKPRVFLFNNPSDYATFIRGSTCPAALPDNVSGYTFLTPTCSVTGNKPYTVVLENSSLLQNQYISLTAAHEMGHWFDELVLGTPTAPYSGSSIWTHEMMGTGAKGDYPTFIGLRGACKGPDYVFNGLTIAFLQAGSATITRAGQDSARDIRPTRVQRT